MVKHVVYFDCEAHTQLVSAVAFENIKNFFVQLSKSLLKIKIKRYNHKLPQLTIPHMSQSLRQELFAGNTRRRHDEGIDAMMLNVA